MTAISSNQAGPVRIQPAAQRACTHNLHAPISARRIVFSAQMTRAVQTAEPVAAARGLAVETDDRFAEYDRDLARYSPIEHIRDENPQEWARMAAGRFRSTTPR